MKNQKGFANIILVVVIVILVGAVGYFVFVKNPVAIQTKIPTPTPTKTADSTASWMTYTNPRAGYQFEYPSTNLTLELNETIKYPDSQTKNQDLVQFAANTKDASEQQPVTFGVRTYVGVKNNSIENWIQNGGSATSSDLANYTKRSIGGQTAYTGRGISVTYILYNYNVYIIDAHAGIEPAHDTDPVYGHILSTFKFTK
ncbi:MAG: hypothetical protein HYX20_02015 [Candidatus Yanofskybacteria bacterium]|nr:hypothetical protein [Candidatus Yanofskybacteria bacterium]